MKVTIITIVRNGEQFIERTIESVLAQTHKDIEYIVIDGASTDATVSLIQKHRQGIARFVSEPDKGISDAWNKGIAMASGDIIGLINAGDEYFPRTVETAVKALTQTPGIVFGDTELVDAKSQPILINKGKFSLWRHSGGLGFYHPSCFASTAVYRKIGSFELGLRYAMDTDWLLRAHFNGIHIRHAPLKVRMLDEGVSVQNRFRAYGEYLHVLQRNSQASHWVYLSMLTTAVRGLLKLALKGKNA